MCGIAGILRVHGPGVEPPPPWESIPERWLDVLDDSIKHRGPDGAGRFRDRATRPDGTVVDVALVHRRLSIIDLACGHQPMVSLARGEGVLRVKSHALGPGLGLYEPGGYEWLIQARGAGEERRQRSSCVEPGLAPPGGSTVAVVFNGCIYNHRELRRELQDAGHVFSTDHSDTEVLVHGWREWERELFSRLDSMHAVAIWDTQAGTLVGARDLAGEKPLYGKWRRDLGVYMFASTAAGLTRLGRAIGPPPDDREEGVMGDHNHLEYHLDFWIRGGSDWELPQPEAEEYPPRFVYDVLGGWTPPEKLNAERDPDAALSAGEVDEMIAEGVRSRLEADVPVGIFLSGGVDSSLLAVHATRLRSDVRSFAVRMPDQAFDESEIARAVAARLGISHTTLECEPSPASDLVRLIHQLGLPFGDSSLLPTYWVSRATREHVAVALSGDGADELFGGYERYAAHQLIRRYGLLLRLLPPSVFPSRSPKSRLTKLSRLVRWAKTGDGPLSIFDRIDHADLTGVPRPSGARPTLVADPLEHDFQTYLPQDLLRKVDTASMAVALETRAPFLTPPLIRACLSAPLTNLMPHGQRKGLLRQVARKYLPSEIVDRPKMGFAIPVGEWFRSDYGGMRTLLLDHLNSAEPFGPPSLGIELNMDFIRQMLKEHDEAGEESLFPWKGRDHSQRLYMLLVLSIWAKWLGGLGS